MRWRVHHADGSVSRGGQTDDHDLDRPMKQEELPFPEPSVIGGGQYPGAPRPDIDERNPKDLLGIKKPQLNLVPPASLIYQALAMQDGARKYGPFNWRSKKVIASIYVAAAMRHIAAWYDGEENAPDSGMPHLAHALACLGIIVDAKETGNLVDDRPLPGAASALLARFEKKT